MDTTELKKLYREQHPQATGSRMTGFDDAVDMLMQRFTEPVVLQAFGEEVLAKCREVQQNFAAARSLSFQLHELARELSEATIDTDCLDDRGAQALALCSALLREFEKWVGSGEARVQVVRAVSYIVWAYLQPGVAEPGTDGTD